jgi:hypothetical protein
MALEHLGRFSQLKLLAVKNSRLTPAAIQQLRQIFPACQIVD